MSDEEELSNAIEGDDGFDAGVGASPGGSGKSKSGLVKILTWVVGIICGTIDGLGFSEQLNKTIKSKMIIKLSRICIN